MKAEELSIGLLVNVGHCHSNIGGDYDVEFVPERLTLEHFKFWADNHWDKNDFDEFLRPIELTTNFLKSNGFVNVFRGRYEYRGENFVIEVSTIKEEIMWVVVTTFDDENYDNNNTTCIKKLKYVHELQKLLQVCKVEMVDIVLKCSVVDYKKQFTIAIEKQ